MKKRKSKKSEKKPLVKNLNEVEKEEFPDRMKFFGSVKLKIDPLVYQRKIRDEWD